jgi:hypothetical protein
MRNALGEIAARQFFQRKNFADVRRNFQSMSAFGGKADISQDFGYSPKN